jgi:hypothetical protein
MRLLLAVVLAATAGCAAKKSSAPAPVGPATEPAPSADVAAPAPDGRGYCYLPELGMCGEFPADAYADGEQLCADNAGTWTTGGCPTAGVLGYCTNPERDGGARLTLYAGVYPDAESARADKCVDEGDVFEPAF